MKQADTYRQRVVLDSLVRASTSDGTRTATFILPKHMDVKLGSSTTLVLRQLIKKGLVVSQDAGGFGVHRPRSVYKPTQAGIDYCKAISC